MLRIRLNDRSGSDGAGSNPANGRENVTVACPHHLVLSELPVAKRLGNASGAKVVKNVGRRVRRRAGEKVHICVRCNFPIAIYGRLSPCSHAFCLTCARSEPTCYLCDERIQKIQTVKMLDGIFMCAAPHCLRSFLKKVDFELHIKETHSDLLQTVAEKGERHQKDVVNPKPSASDFQFKQPLHVQPQVLAHSPSASFLASQHQYHNSEVQSLQSQPKVVPVLSGIPQHAERHSQQHQFTRSSSGTKQQHQEQHLSQDTQLGQIGFQGQPRQQDAYHSNTGASPPQQYQEKQQGLEKQSDQLHQGKQHVQSYEEIGHSQLEKHHRQDTDQHHQQQQGKPQHDGSHQGNPAKQALWGCQPLNQPIQGFTNQSEIPVSFTTQSLQYSFPMQPEVRPQQQFNSNYQPIRFGFPVPVQTGFQSFQENNPRMPIQPPIIPDFQQNYPRQGYVGTSGLPHGARTAIQGTGGLPHGAMTAIPGTGGYMPQQQQRAFHNFQNDYGQRPIGMPMPLQPEGVGMAPNQSPHYQNVPQGPHIAPQPPKRRKVQNVPDQGDTRSNAQNNQWGGGVSNSHPRPGYGGRSGNP